jgi:hypothetical protein
MVAMNKLLAAALCFPLVLFLQGCASAPVMRDPISMRSYPADAYAESNLLVFNQLRMALPEGWRFKGRRSEDPKDILLFIEDTGSNTVNGGLRYTRFDTPVSISRVANYYANEVMGKFSDRQIAKTELDGEEAYIVQGTWENGNQRASALIQQGRQGLLDITLITDPGYITREPGTIYTIFNSYQFMPQGISERRIKGMFSFKCDDSTLEWRDDARGTWVVHGFGVSGDVAGTYLGINIEEVKTARFEDFIKPERMTIKEFETEVHFAGKSFPAKAIGRVDTEKKYVMVYFLFKHGGKQYLMYYYRPTEAVQVANPLTFHQEPEIRRALDTYFYFDN